MTLAKKRKAKMLKILGIPASNSDESINALLVRHALDLIKTELNIDTEYSVLDLNDYEMPIYKVERQAKNGIPKAAKTFVRAISFSDALIMSFAEHNGNYSVAFKNIFDWASRFEQKIYQAKPIFMMATSPGARGGAGVLEIASTAAPYFGGKVIATFSLPRFGETFDRERNVILDIEKSDELSSLVRRFALTLTGEKVEEV